MADYDMGADLFTLTDEEGVEQTEVLENCRAELAELSVRYEKWTQAVSDYDDYKQYQPVMKEEIIDEYLNREGLQEIKKMLYHPGYIPNTELPAVYSGASVFIYTSLRESFGIPILEAMACGTPVITSTTSAMPEIAGPEGILVNPFKPEEIASALLHLEENAEFYQSQTAYGLERVRRFSWENTAREILNIYKEILA